MAFFVRKLLAEALMPLPLALALGVAGWIVWARGKRTRLGQGMVAVSLLALTTLSMGPVAVPLIGAVEGDAVPFPGDSVDYVVVLGHGHDSDPSLPPSAWPEPEALYRIAEGARIAQAQPWADVVVSGFSGRDARSHADVSREVMISLGVDPSRIVAEGAATTTAEEAQLLEDRLRGRRFALVTSASHMPRASRLFRARGLDPVEAPTGHLSRRPAVAYAILGVIPSASNLQRAHAAWYETLSATWARIRGDM